MKKVLIVIFSILFIISTHLALRYITNEFYISKSNKGYYDNNIYKYLLILNYPESYIVYYNKGNNEYNNGDYETAIEDYEKALETVTKKRECIVRNNLSLTRIKLLNPNNKSFLNDIEVIENILLTDNCANKDLKSGKNKNSQTIYNELQELKKSSSSGGGSGGDDPSDPSDPSGGETEKEKEIEKELKKQQKETQKEREEGKRHEFEYCRGKCW